MMPEVPELSGYDIRVIAVAIKHDVYKGKVHSTYSSNSAQIMAKLVQDGLLHEIARMYKTGTRTAPG
ncbi:MAG: hypothetical protein ACXABF_16965 [Candidatus Thorarchaeota archaeon]|jgi:chromosome segregation and condensation protein ScpB